MKRIALAILVVLPIAGAAAWFWSRQSLPPLDGEAPLAGLRAPVEVIFDAYGVPTAYAQDTDDGWFVAGALHARDRLWQMELYRRVTAGRLSEAMGAETLPIDRRFLTLGLRPSAEAEWQRAGPAVRTALERYAAGVNAVMAGQTGRRRPLEMQALGIVPAPWTPIDSLAVSRLLAFRLAENHQAELVRAALAERLGGDAARELTGRYPADGPAILGQASGDSPLRGSSDSALRASWDSVLRTSRDSVLRTSWDSPLRGSSDSAASPPRGRGGEGRAESAAWPVGLEWLHPGARRGNSNNWVVAGRKTASGRPLLANDPHLPIEFPSVWYELHLVAAGLDVAGVTVPGVPFVVLGHNARVAWGMTNTGADVQDLFLERIDIGRRRVLSRGAWVPVEVTPADIPVRGRATPVPFEVWKTPHGPIFAEVGLDWQAPPSWLSPEGRETGERRAYAMRWDIDGELAAAFEALDRAADWTTFVDAVGRFALPSQNIVYADVDGNIGYAMSGRVPIRASGDGARPIDGGGSDGDWVRTIDPAELPRAFNPASGYLTSSNNEIDRGFAGLITRDYSAPFRAARLHERLSAAEGLDTGRMADLQNDRRSLAAELVLKAAATAAASGRARGADPAAVSVLERLAAWDRVVDARHVVSLYEAFEDALWRRTFQDDMDEALFRKFYEWAGAERPAGLYVVLGDRQSRWFDDIATVDRRETRDDICLLAAADAEARVQAAGAEPSRAWDRVHAASFDHPLGGVAAPLSWLFSRGPVPVTGDGTTVMRTSWNRLRPFGAWEVPSWRQILDVGHWDLSRVVLPGGQSGHPLSPHYFDQNPLWREGRYRSHAFSRAAVLAGAAHRLLFVP